MTEPTNETPRTEAIPTVSAAIAALHKEYQVNLDKWADLELGTRESIRLEDERDILTMKIIDSVPGILDALAAETRQREATEAALKPFVTIYRSYLEDSHIIAKDDYESHFWTWLVGRAAPNHMRKLFEGAVTAYATAQQEARDDGER